DFLRSLGAPDWPQALTLSLFAYPQAPLADLLKALADDARPSLCLLAAGPAQAAAREFFGGTDWPVGTLRQCGHLQALALPFLDQDAYDRLLWSCELNFVRGEDSFLRAQWA